MATAVLMVYLWGRRPWVKTSKAARVLAPFLVTLPYPKREDGSATVTLDSYRKLEVLEQQKVYDSFDGSSASWERLAVCLCHMSKVGHPWKAFVAKFQGHPVFQNLSGQEKVTEARLLLWLLEVSDKDVQRHLMREAMKDKPVPIATAWPQKRFCQELLWTMPKIPTLGSFKLNAKVSGVSNVLNQLFDTNFERTGSNFGAPEHPHVQLQFDADMKPESRRGFAVIDVHGTVCQESWSLELARACPFLLLHMKEKDLKSKKVQSLVKDLCMSHRCETLWIMIWDDGEVGVRKRSATSLRGSEGGRLPCRIHVGCWSL